MKGSVVKDDVEEPPACYKQLHKPSNILISHQSIQKELYDTHTAIMYGIMYIPPLMAKVQDDCIKKTTDKDLYFTFDKST